MAAAYAAPTTADRVPMDIVTAQAILAKNAQDRAAGRRAVEHDPDFPLLAQWRSFPFSSNEHYAVAKALGQGMGDSRGVPTPVDVDRPFFRQLLDAGLVDRQGHATEALKREVEERDSLRELEKAGFFDIGATLGEMVAATRGARLEPPEAAAAAPPSPSPSPPDTDAQPATPFGCFREAAVRFCVLG